MCDQHRRRTTHNTALSHWNLFFIQTLKTLSSVEFMWTCILYIKTCLYKMKKIRCILASQHRTFCSYIGHSFVSQISSILYAKINIWYLKYISTCVNDKSTADSRNDNTTVKWRATNRIHELLAPILLLFQEISCFQALLIFFIFEEIAQIKHKYWNVDHMFR